jgi:prepilin-type N-terminal cleavage/methylation domain-containing protein
MLKSSWKLMCPIKLSLEPSPTLLGGSRSKWMRRWNSEKQRMQRGFTLTELMIVVAVALVIAAVAVPNVIRGMRHLRLRSAATSVVGILQQARQRAVRDNRNYQVLEAFLPPNNAVRILYVDLNWDAAYQRGEPMVTLPGDVVPTAASPINSQQLEQAMSPTVPVGTEKLVIPDGNRAKSPTFNPRGRACEPVLPVVPPNGIAVCNTLNGLNQLAYGIFLRSTTLRNDADGDGWAAVSVSPGGRIRRWNYDPINKNWE